MKSRLSELSELSAQKNLTISTTYLTHSTNLYIYNFLIENRENGH